MLPMNMTLLVLKDRENITFLDKEDLENNQGVYYRAFDNLDYNFYNIN